MSDRSCGVCAFEADDECLSKMPIAMAYVPMQKFQNLHTAENAFCAGTLYKELEMPFLGSEVRR